LILRHQVRAPAPGRDDEVYVGRTRDLGRLGRLLPSGHFRQLANMIISRDLDELAPADLVRQRRAYPRRYPGGPRTATGHPGLDLEMERDNPSGVPPDPRGGLDGPWLSDRAVEKHAGHGPL